MPADIVIISTLSSSMPISPRSFFARGHSSGGLDITIFKMAISFQTAGDIYAIRALLEGLEDMDGIYLSGTGYPDDLDVGWIIEAHTTCHVCCGVGAVVAAEGYDNRFKLIPIMQLSFLNSPSSFARI